MNTPTRILLIEDDSGITDTLQRVLVAEGHEVMTETRGDDGLFHTADTQPADADPTVTVAPASLEGSNVNAVSAMVDMITNARQFQMQTKLLDSANSNDQSANKLLDFS